MTTGALVFPLPLPMGPPFSPGPFSASSCLGRAAIVPPPAMRSRKEEGYPWLLRAQMGPGGILIFWGHWPLRLFYVVLSAVPWPGTKSQASRGTPFPASWLWPWPGIMVVWSGSEGKCNLYPSPAMLSPPQELDCLPLASVLDL